MYKNTQDSDPSTSHWFPEDFNARPSTSRTSRPSISTGRVYVMSNQAAAELQLKKDDDMWCYRNQDRLIAAVENDDVASLLRLSDARGLCKFADCKTGNTLLHIAVSKKRKKVFQCLLAIEGFPLNKTNHNNETALKLSATKVGYNQDRDTRDIYDGFSSQMIIKGAFVTSTYGETFLHHAIKHGYVETSKALMDAGCDVNVQNFLGETPFLVCFDRKPPKEQTELAIALLYHGADATFRQPRGYSAFEYAMKSRSYDLRKAFVDYVVDDHTSINVRFDVLVMLQIEDVHLFRIVLQQTNKVIVSDDCGVPINFLQSVDTNDLDVFIKKCPDAFRNVLANRHTKFYPPPDHWKSEQVISFDTYDTFVRYPVEKSCQNKFLENLSLLFESELGDDIACFMKRFSLHYMPLPEDEAFAAEFLYLLLSYGMTVTKNHLTFFYDRYGFGELTRLVLETEIEPDTCMWLNNAFLDFLYDVRSSPRQMFCKISTFAYERLHRGRQADVLHFFADSTLREVFGPGGGTDVVATIARQPAVPLLVELARNRFREVAVRNFNITSAHQFHAFVNKLPIAAEHKKIITFEKQLY